MDDLFTKLGLNSKYTIGVSISSNNSVEMIYVDKMTRTITKYASRELRYNNAIREIIDYDELSTALSELFKELSLDPKQCNVILNMPNVHFAFMYLPLILADDQVTNAIISEVEQLYLFKRHEPVISWSAVDTNKESDKRYIAYTALQDSVISNIREIFEELGTKLIVIENSHSSILKGIQYSKIVEEEITNNSPYNILLITSNSYAVFCMNGNRLVDYYEEPLAIKSFTNDEVYLAISSAASSTLEHYPTPSLLLISETNEVSAELLSEKMNFNGAIKYLDRNKYSDKAFMNIDFSVLQNYIPMISLESVGAATYNYENYPLKFNFLSELGDVDLSGPLTVNVFGKEIEIDRKAIVTILATIVGCLVVIFGVLGFGLSSFNNKMVTEIDKLTQEQITLENKIKESKISVDVADIYTISQDIYTANKSELALFNGLSSEIPPEVWVDSFFTNSEGEVIITGKSTGTEHIYRFFKGLKQRDPNVFISRLQLDYDENQPLTAIKPTNSILLFEINSTKNKKPTQTDATSDSLNPQEGQDGHTNPAANFFSFFEQKQNGAQQNQNSQAPQDANAPGSANRNMPMVPPPPPPPTVDPQPITPPTNNQR